MIEDCNTILRVLRTEDAPDGGWTASVLRKLCGLSALNFSRAAERLRLEGKLMGDRLALSCAAMGEATPPPPTPTLAEEVHAEAVAQGANRKAVQTVTTL